MLNSLFHLFRYVIYYTFVTNHGKLMPIIVCLCLDGIPLETVQGGGQIIPYVTTNKHELAPTDFVARRPLVATVHPYQQLLLLFILHCHH